MKKRILGLALALVMIISLLPLTAFAETTPLPKVNIIDPNYTSSTNHYVFTGGITGTNTLYLAFENVLDADGTTVLGNKPVQVTKAPEDNYVKIFYNASTNTLEITLHNVTYNRTAADEAFFSCTANTPSSKYNNQYDVLMTLEGTNTITGSGAGFNFSNKGDLTITGSGSLNMKTLHSGSSKGANINKLVAGDLFIKNTTLNLTNSYTASATAVIMNNGHVTISGSDVTLHTAKCYGIKTADKYNGTMADATKGVTVTGSNLQITGIADDSGAMTYASSYLIQTNGPLTFESSNVELHRGEANHNPMFKYAPSITGTHTDIQYKTHLKNSWKNYSTLNLTAGDTLTTDHDLRHFKLVHKHEAVAGEGGDCTKGILCACGYTITAGAPAHVAGAGADDCTKDTMCGNADCKQVFEKATATAHEAGEDDGDCTTDIKCKNCEQVAVKGAEKHTYTRTDCSKEAVCTVCNKVVAKAGEHSGGTATCKDKAKCEVCNAEYGELAACKPAADDGDCTTAIKCSVCGKETTAGQAAHKYTDKADTTCDNAGCTNTRKVEGDATENPKTGDTALVLIACLMMASAAAFVCTKKFAR